MAPFTIRRAEEADAPAIVDVHTQSWQETYTGLVSPDFLNTVTSHEARQQREESWRVALLRGREMLVAEQSGQVVAFAVAGPARDYPGYTHELLMLYSLKRAQGQGIGKALLRAAVAQVQQQGGDNLALWVLNNNPTRQWYAAQGAREAGEKVDGELVEVRMVWDSLTF